MGAMSLQGSSSSIALEMTHEQQFVFQLMKHGCDAFFFATQDAENATKWVNQINGTVAKLKKVSTIKLIKVKLSRDKNTTRIGKNVGNILS